MRKVALADLKYQQQIITLMVHIIKKSNHMTDNMHGQNTKSTICTTCELNLAYKIKFLKGSISIDSYRLIFSSNEVPCLKG